MYDKTPESLCYMNQLKNMIFSECMMLVSGRVLYLYAMCHEDDSGGTLWAHLYAMCHEDDSGGTLWAQMCMKNWRGAILKTADSSAQQ